MSAADHLKGVATAIFNQMRDRKVSLQSEYDELQSKLARKKAELDSEVDILSSVYQRLLSFTPLVGNTILCPRCWVINGKESAAIEQGDVVRCGACHQEFSISEQQ
jgi:hypothetical protein